VGLFRLRFTPTGVSYARTATVDLPDTFQLSDGTSWSPCDEPGVGPQVEGMVVDGERGV
jgi:3-phytase